MPNEGVEKRNLKLFMENAIVQNTSMAELLVIVYVDSHLEKENLYLY
jgi:hypothetical protein